MTTPKSTYPLSVDDLLPRAQELAARLGKLPSQNKLKEHLHVGAPKAAAVLKALRAEPGETTGASTATRLHLVPDASETAPDSVTVSETASNTTDAEPAEEPTAARIPEKASPQVPVDAESPARPGTGPVWTVLSRWRPGSQDRRAVSSWPLLLLALPAFVAIWAGWVGLGGLTGFGIVHPFPGVPGLDQWTLNTAITLPIGVETYAAYALRVWLSGRVPPRARRYAKYSALGSLALGGAGQVSYHLMTAYGVTAAPWGITTVVACLPVAVLGMGAALRHLVRDDEPGEEA